MSFGINDSRIYLFVFMKLLLLYLIQRLKKTIAYEIKNNYCSW